MAEYVTLIEAAELEDVKYNTMVRRITRNPDKFDTMTEKSENGGKDAVLVAIASLSKKARNAWKERAKLKELSGTISPEAEAQPEPEAPWYVEADVDWYIENYREQWYKGMELGNVIREFLQYDGANKTEYAEQYAQEHLGSGKRTLYRYVKAYNEACAWADKLQKESGVGFEFFKVLCLCRKPKESGTFPSIKPEVKQVIKNIWFNEDFAANLGTREMLYEKLTLVANVNKWEKIPSYQTVTRYITYLMEDEGMKNAHFLASKGSREYKNKVMVKGSRDTSGLKVMQIVMGDEHTFDCWVAYKQPNGKVIPIKPHLAAYRLTIDFFEYLKLNGLWNLTGSRVMDSQRVEYPTKQSYKTAVHNKENLTVTWHEEHNLFFLDGTWSLDGSKIIDAYQKTEVM